MTGSWRSPRVRVTPWAVALIVALLAGCSQDAGRGDDGPAPSPTPTAGVPPGLPPPAGNGSAPPTEPAPFACDACGVRTADARASEPSVAIHPSDPLRLAVAAIEGDVLFVQGVGQVPVQGPGWAGLTVRRSSDGGATWERTVLPHAGTAEPGSAWSLYCVTADPILEYAGDELRLYGLGWPCTQGLFPSATSAGSIWMAVSADDGATWSEPRTVTQSPGAAEWPDKEWVATDPADPDRILAVWMGIVQLGRGGAVLRASHSSDGGMTWSAPATVTDTTAEGSSASFFAMPAFVPDGAVVSYRSCGGGCVKVAASADLEQWTAVEVAAVEAVPREGGQAMGAWHPSLAAMPGTGTLALAWSGAGPDGSSDAFVSFSADGLEWTTPATIPGLNGTAGDQWWPFVAATADGFHGFMYDRSEDPANLDTRPVAWRADADGLRSAAAGPAWNVTESSFAFYGDYAGADASPKAAALAWGQLGDDGFRYIHAARVPLG